MLKNKTKNKFFVNDSNKALMAHRKKVIVLIISQYRLLEYNYLS